MCCVRTLLNTNFVTTSALFRYPLAGDKRKTENHDFLGHSFSGKTFEPSDPFGKHENDNRPESGLRVPPQVKKKPLNVRFLCL